MSRSDGTIRLAALRRFPERPASEFEWEDLLLRLEIMPRALKVELERTKVDEALPILAELTERELAVQGLLEEVAIAADPRETAGSRATTGIDSSARSRARASMPEHAATESLSGPPNGPDVERFVRLRGRNFAMLQRRGIDVWNWRVRASAEGEATVFQLLSLLALDDVDALARLRMARDFVADAC